MVQGPVGAPEAMGMPNSQIIVTISIHFFVIYLASKDAQEAQIKLH